MSSLQEWQDKLITDFPEGAVVRPPGMIASDGIAYVFRTAAITPFELNVNGFPVLLFWDYDSDRDFHLTVLAYSKIQDNPLHIEITTIDNKKWMFFGSLNPDMTKENYWQDQVKLDREAAMRGGV